MKAKRINEIVTEETDTTFLPHEPLVYQTCIVYVPQENLAVVADGLLYPYRQKDLDFRDKLISRGQVHDPVSKRYTVMLGEDAKELFERVLRENRKTSPENIEVSLDFVEWAKLMYQVNQIPNMLLQL